MPKEKVNKPSQAADADSGGEMVHAELSVDPVGSDEDLETGMRSNATSGPVLGRGQRLVDDHSVSEKSTDAESTMCSSAIPQLQEQLRQFLGRVLSLSQLEKRPGHRVIIKTIGTINH